MSSLAPSPPAERSSFVTALAWCTIVPAALAVLVATLQNIVVSTMMPIDQMLLPSGPEMEHLPAFAVFMFEHLRAVLVAFWLMSAVSLASGIGLLLRKEWARLFVIAMLWLSIVLNIGGLFVQQSVFNSVASMSEIPPEFQAQLEGIVSTVWVVSIAMTVVFSAMSGWLIWRLASAPIKAEFGAAP